MFFFGYLICLIIIISTEYPNIVIIFKCMHMLIIFICWIKNNNSSNILENLIFKNKLIGFKKSLKDNLKQIKLEKHNSNIIFPFFGIFI